MIGRSPMGESHAHKSDETKAGTRWLFAGILVVMAFTGFGQMPIFKRYYVSDIPGMGWSADFYFTHYVHYLGASILLAYFAYIVCDYLLVKRGEFRLTGSAYVRLVLLAGIIGTGIFRVLKNLPDTVFSPGFTLFIDVAHLGFVILYLIAALAFSILKSRWIKKQEHGLLV